MTNNDLYLLLKNAYTAENLNNITAHIIQLYKTKQYQSIRKISSIVSEYTDFPEKNMSKSFSRLIMIYHPDKEAYYKQELDKLYFQGQPNSLKQFAHILVVGELNQNNLEEDDFEVDEDVDYAPEYVWEYDRDGFDYIDPEEDTEVYIDQDFIEENNFYNALKRKIYGSVQVEVPTYYLEDFEDIEMAEYEIESLEGIEYCIHAINIDLSKNLITDLSPLWKLDRTEELYLANNQISYIDALSNLKNLRVVDLSNNFIEDISPLFEIETLEYLNIIGNKIPQIQIDEFLKKDLVLLY